MKKSKKDVYLERLDKVLAELREKLSGSTSFMGQAPKLYFKGKIDGIKLALDLYNKPEKTNDTTQKKM